ncbi:MAG: Rrf2 family transcriptional regulator [Lactobacillus sp.]|jgi:Rrf2 family protein|nr:Rrf2 family transcriptional regulator [Lactobacillus sp.]
MAFSIAFSQALEIAAYVGIKSDTQHYDYLSIQKISEKLNIPIPSIKKISTILKKNGILSSKTGINGGLRLAKAPQAITIYDIFVAMEGTNPIFKVHQDFDTKAFLNPEKVQNWLGKSTAVLTEAQAAMMQVLKQTSLADMAGQ